MRNRLDLFTGPGVPFSNPLRLHSPLSLHYVIYVIFTGFYQILYYNNSYAIPYHDPVGGGGGGANTQGVFRKWYTSVCPLPSLDPPLGHFQLIYSKIFVIYIVIIY